MKGKFFVLLFLTLILITGCKSNGKVLTCKEKNSVGSDIELVLYYDESGNTLQNFKSSFKRTLVNDGTYDIEKAYKNLKEGLESSCSEYKQEYDIDTKCDFNDKNKSFYVEYSGESSKLNNLNNIFSIILLDVKTDDFKNLTEMTYDEMKNKIANYENISCK